MRIDVMKSRSRRGPSNPVPMRICRRGNLKTGTSTLELTEDIQADVSAILCRILRRFGADLLTLEVGRHQARFLVAIDEAVDADEMLGHLRRQSAASMFQLLPTIRNVVTKPDDIWQGPPVGVDRRQR